MNDFLFNLPEPQPKRPSLKGLSIKQGVIMQEMMIGNPGVLLTLDRAVELVGGNIYHNKQKHVGSLLANMVRQGLIKRVKPGVFELS